MADESTWERWGAIAGLIFVVIGILTAVLPGSPPSASDPDRDVLKFLSDKQSALQVTAFLNGIALIAATWWFGIVRGRLGRAEGSPTQLATLGFVAGAIGGAMFSVGNAITAAMVLQVDSGGMNGRLAGVLYDITNTLAATAGFAFAAALLAYAAVILRTAAFPSWLGWVAIVDAGVWIVGGLAVTSDASAFLGVLFLGFFGLLVFVLGTSVVMLQRRPTATV